MFNLLKILGSIAIATGIGFGLAVSLESLFQEPSLRSPAVSESPVRQKDVPIVPVPKPTAPSLASRVDSFLADADSERARWKLREDLGALGLEGLQELFIEAMSRDMQDRRSLEIASEALQAIARREPELARDFLLAARPAERAKLASAVAAGWAESDAGSAWEWIAAAWVGPDGRYVDRKLQHDMQAAAVDALLVQNKDYAQAALLASEIVDPEQKRRLADLIALRAVSDNPEQAMDRLAFASSDYLDAAIMDAIVDEWSQRDPLGARNWTLGNEDQVSLNGARLIAKQLFQNGADGDLVGFHQGLAEWPRKDSVAAEAARLFARRDPVVSTDWIQAIRSSSSKLDAATAALYEIGHDSFDHSMAYIDRAFAMTDESRLAAVYRTLKDWSKVDADTVKGYLNSTRSGLPPEDAAFIQESLFQ